MKLALCSDLHVNFKNLPNSFYENGQGVDALLIAGDVVESKYIKDYKSIFDRLSSLYPKVILISGNHEFYSSNWNKSKQHMKDFTSQYLNVIYLDNQFLNLNNDYVLIGSTLWTDYNKNDPMTKLWASANMNDHKLIRLESKNYSRLFPDDCYQFHMESKQFIEESIRRNNGMKFVVMTHHAPSFQSVHPYYKSEIKANGCYASDFDSFIEEHPEIVLWQHGHMHNNSDYYISDCRVVCHPRGYPPSCGASNAKDVYYKFKPLIVDV